jgi:hypothetical protein
MKGFRIVFSLETDFTKAFEDSESNFLSYWSENFGNGNQEIKYKAAKNLLINIIKGYSSKILNLAAKSSSVQLKGTVPRNFSPKLLFMKHISLGP